MRQGFSCTADSTASGSAASSSSSLTSYPLSSLSSPATRLASSAAPASDGKRGSSTMGFPITSAVLLGARSTCARSSGSSSCRIMPLETDSGSADRSNPSCISSQGMAAAAGFSISASFRRSGAYRLEVVRDEQLEQRVPQLRIAGGRLDALLHEAVDEPALRRPQPGRRARGLRHRLELEHCRSSCP